MPRDRGTNDNKPFICRKKMSLKSSIPVLLALVALGTLSCRKNSGCDYTFASATVSDSEVTALHDSLNAHGILGLTATKPGYFYQLVSNGSAQAANSPCSQLTMTYTAKLLNGGTTVDSSAAGMIPSFNLAALIPGLQQSLQLIQGSGEIIVYLPPALAYGSQPYYDNQGHVLIPANSDLVFDVKVTAVKNP